MELIYSSKHLLQKIIDLGEQPCGFKSRFCFFPADIKSNDMAYVFSIKRNSMFMKVSDYNISGSFYDVDLNRTKVDFQIVPNTFGLWYLRLMPLIALGFINYIIYSTTDRQGFTQMTIITIAILIPWIWTLWKSRNMKSKLHFMFSNYLLEK